MSGPIDFLGDVLLPLARKAGAVSIKDLPGCWELQVDDHWFLAVNAHLESITCSTGANVEPGHAYVEYNGWPAGSVNIFGDGMFAAGEAANLDTFRAACEAYRS